MFNTLGIYSNPFPPGTHPTQGVGPLSPTVVIPSSGINSIGGYGNDIFNNGTINNGNGYTGSVGYTGSQGIPGSPGGYTGSQGAVGFTGSQGDIGFTGSAGGLQVPVTIVTSVAPYQATLNDYYIGMSVGAPSVVNFPAITNVTGQIFIVKDILGQAGPPTNNTITITDFSTIDGAASALINTNYGALSFIFNGTEWNIV